MITAPKITYTTAFRREYKLVLDHAVFVGYALPSYDVMFKQNSLYRGWINVGIWQESDVIWLLANDSGDENFGRIMIKNPGTNTLAKTGTLTYTSKDGVKGDGSTGYYDTGWQPNGATKYLSTNGGYFVDVKESAQEATRAIFGAQVSGSLDTTNFVSRTATDTINYRISQDSTRVITGQTDGSGFFQGMRTASNAIAMYRNGSSIDSFTTASSNRANAAVYIFAANTSATASAFSAKTVRVLALGSSMSSLVSVNYKLWQEYFLNL